MHSKHPLPLPVFRRSLLEVRLIFFLEPQRMVLARGFVGRLERSGGISVSSRTSKEAGLLIDALVQFLRAVVDCVCVMGTVRLMHLTSHTSSIDLQMVSLKQLMEHVVDLILSFLRYQSCRSQFMIPLCP
ncbi:hypothetical protein AVEN_43608-1 [Araneus ventricosus]|uniref:Uncharacterized protein n=1 Tax=Araneus ventricosus TaxID=182803 RepID=A0A4Y2MQX0_ARAVE|nr:hypothetical protein AVEN_43608-1 [Araneus ventricosus]